MTRGCLVEVSMKIKLGKSENSTELGCKGKSAIEVPLCNGSYLLIRPRAVVYSDSKLSPQKTLSLAMLCFSAFHFLGTL